MCVFFFFFSLERKRRGRGDDFFVSPGGGRKNMRLCRTRYDFRLKGFFKKFSSQLLKKRGPILCVFFFFFFSLEWESKKRRRGGRLFCLEAAEKKNMRLCRTRYDFCLKGFFKNFLPNFLRKEDRFCSTFFLLLLLLLLLSRVGVRRGEEGGDFFVLICWKK